MQSQAKTTPLHEWHVSSGATMGDFSGWSMPLWYRTGAIAEHRVVITHAGLFDTSDMEVLLIGGPHAFDLLQTCFTRDLSRCVADSMPLEAGSCVYGAFLNDRGEVIDDAIVYQLDQETYMVAINAGMGATVSTHLARYLTHAHTSILVCGAQVAKIDLQGPLSAKILWKVLQEPDQSLSDLAYFRFTGHFDGHSRSARTRLRGGASILLSRTGYTGEFGFEIFVDAARLRETWETLLSAGKELGLLPCGLAARDSLRTGAVLPLSHQDIGPWPFINHPWSFALPWNRERTAFTKTFVGDRVLTMQEHAAHTHAFVGYDPRKTLPQDRPVVRDAGGKDIGVVLTCVTDMALERDKDRILSIASPDKPDHFKPRGLSCGFVRVMMRLRPGEIVELKDTRRALKVMIVEDIRPDRTARRPMRDMLYGDGR